MKTATRLAIFALLTGLGLLYCKAGAKKCRPIFYPEAERLTSEIYAKHNETGELPKLEDLSIEAQEIVSDANGINYSFAEGFRFDYDKSYPSNIPLSAILTLGYVTWPAGDSITGYRLSPSSIANNASLR